MKDEDFLIKNDDLQRSAKMMSKQGAQLAALLSYADFIVVSKTDDF